MKENPKNSFFNGKCGFFVEESIIVMQKAKNSVGETAVVVITHVIVHYGSPTKLENLPDGRSLPRLPLPLPQILRVPGLEVRKDL